MNKRAREIFYDFDGKLVGTKLMQKYVCQTLSLMPEKTIKFVTKNCWFVSSMDDAWGFVFKGNDLKNQYLIFLSEDLFRQHARQIHYSITHEIGHVMLGHRNSVFVKQTKAEIKKQEKEADAFAKESSR